MALVLGEAKQGFPEDLFGLLGVDTGEQKQTGWILLGCFLIVVLLFPMSIGLSTPKRPKSQYSIIRRACDSLPIPCVSYVCSCVSVEFFNSISSCNCMLNIAGPFCNAKNDFCSRTAGAWKTQAQLQRKKGATTGYFVLLPCHSEPPNWRNFLEHYMPGRWWILRS